VKQRGRAVTAREKQDKAACAARIRELVQAISQAEDAANEAEARVAVYALYVKVRSTKLPDAQIRLRVDPDQSSRMVHVGSDRDAPSISTSPLDECHRVVDVTGAFVRIVTPRGGVGWVKREYCTRLDAKREKKSLMRTVREFRERTQSGIVELRRELKALRQKRSDARDTTAAAAAALRREAAGCAAVAVAAVAAAFGLVGGDAAAVGGAGLGAAEITEEERPEIVGNEATFKAIGRKSRNLKYISNLYDSVSNVGFLSAVCIASDMVNPIGPAATQVQKLQPTVEMLEHQTVHRCLQDVDKMVQEGHDSGCYPVTAAFVNETQASVAADGSRTWRGVVLSSKQGFTAAWNAGKRVLVELSQRLRRTFTPSALVEAYQKLHPREWVRATQADLACGGPRAVRDALRLVVEAHIDLPSLQGVIADWAALIFVVTEKQDSLLWHFGERRWEDVTHSRWWQFVATLGKGSSAEADLCGRLRLIVLAHLVLINVRCEALLESIFSSLKIIADEHAGATIHPVALQRQLILKRDEDPWMTADLREAILLFLSKPRRGIRFRRQRERKQRADKGRLRVVRPGQRVVFVDHTGLQQLVEGEVPSDVEVGEVSSAEGSSSSSSSPSSDARDTDVSSEPDSD
jgi:hypothetical protein